MRSLCTKGRLPVAVHTPYNESGNGLKFLQDLQGSFGINGSVSLGDNGVCHKTQAKKSVALESK